MSTGVRNLTQGGIFQQLTRLALPIMATSFLQMGYSLTDMAWVGRLGSEAAAAVGAVGILVWLINSIALLTKVGAEISIGHAIGAKKLDRAKIYASHTTTIALIISIITGLFFFAGAEIIIPFFRLEDTIAKNAIEYLQIVSTGFPFIFLTLTFSGIYNASGRSQIPFYLTAVGLVANMILDPLFIFGIGSIEGMGTRGAAIATCISQAVVTGLFVWQMKRKNGILNRFPYFIRINLSYTREILRLGFPVAVMNVLFASINLYLARIASVYGGHIGVSSQTTGGQIEGITWNTSQGFSTALGAFVAQNYAAGKFDRLKKAYLYTLQMLCSLGVIVTLSFFFWGENIFGIFIPEEAARISGGEYLKIVGLSQIFMMLELTTQGMFNGTGRTLPPAIISIGFNVARIPLAFYLCPHIGTSGVWWAITISTICKGIILPLWFSLASKKINKTSINS